MTFHCASKEPTVGITDDAVQVHDFEVRLMPNVITDTGIQLPCFLLNFTPRKISLPVGYGNKTLDFLGRLGTEKMCLHDFWLVSG